jgi:hypothetical protein
MRDPMAIAARRHFIRRYVPLVISRGDIYRVLRRVSAIYHIVSGILVYGSPGI